MKIFFLFFIILVIIQWYFKMKQTQVMQTHYNKFLEAGNVLVERHKGAFSGAIIMFQLDKEGNIQDCMLMSGATFFATWRNCEKLINKNLLRIGHEDLITYKKPIQLVIDKAIKSYHENKEEELQQKLI